VNLPGGGTTSFLSLVSSALGTSLNASQLGELVFLHEPAHIAGQSASVVDTNFFNSTIVSKCIN
jgi:hypothetical protein